MPGGRFNMGEIEALSPPELTPTHLLGFSSFPMFSALYFAKDKDTALQETLGQRPVSKNSALTPQEIALTHPQSQTIVSVSGIVEIVIDICRATSLELFRNSY